tara:strand:- start:69 stop:605 length:537 start_codon:yes stop_codon:yes gene_type:complete
MENRRRNYFSNITYPILEEEGWSSLYPGEVLPRIQPGDGWVEGGILPRIPSWPKLPSPPGGGIPKKWWPRIFPWPIPDIPQREPSFDPPPAPLYPNQRGIPPSGPQVAVENWEAQNPPKQLASPDKENDLLAQLLMSALMGQPEGGNQGDLGYGVGGEVPFGDPWVMRRSWEPDYRYV